MQREIMTSIPFLSQPSAAAENTEEDLAVAQDLKDTLDAHRNGCVGMAANMIGVPTQPLRCASSVSFKSCATAKSASVFSASTDGWLRNGIDVMISRCM